MRIVVSLTTLPGRYSKLSRTLDSIINQTVRPHDIYLSIPKRARRLNIEYPPLPDEISSKCKVISLDNDYGPICKILGGLLIEKDPETIIITVDDDIIYPLDLIEKLLNHSNKYPNSAIGSTGLLLGKNLLGYSSVSSLSPSWNGFTGFEVPSEGRSVDILCGVSGILYKRKFFPNNLKDLLQYSGSHESLFMNDDIVLSLYIGSLGIEKRLFIDLPHIKNNPSEKDSNSISISRANFLKRFHEAIQLSREMGFLNNPAPTNFDDGFILRFLFGLTIIMILIMTVFIIFR